MTNAEKTRTRERFSTVRVFAVVLAICAAIASAEFYSLWQSRHADAPPPVAQLVPKAPVEGPIGAVDMPSDEAIVGPQVRVSGWALDSVGVARVEIRLDDLRFNAVIGVARPDVTLVKKDFPQSDRAGFEFTGDFTAYAAAPGVDRRILSVVAVAQDGRESVLGRKSVIEPAALTRWRDVAQGSSPSFYLLPALSGIRLGGAQQLDTQYLPYVSRTMKVGMRVPILYLRTTKGAAADYAFDPDWDIERRCGERRIAEDSLAATLDHERSGTRLCLADDRLGSPKERIGVGAVHVPHAFAVAELVPVEHPRPRRFQRGLELRLERDEVLTLGRRAESAVRQLEVRDERVLRHAL